MRKLLKSLLFIFCLSMGRAEQNSLGSIQGFVKFPGETPPRNMYANATDHDCPHGIAQTHLLVKQETRGLQNALVILERHNRRVMPTRLAAELRTVGCQLLPRVQWVPLGTSLTLVKKDGAAHHLHAYQKDNAMFEADLTAESPTARRPLVVPGLYKINCDVHPWERAWVYASPHDSVAVTDSRGQFTIKNVPAGRYRILAWHEGWMEQTGPAGLPAGRQGRLEYVPMQDLRHIKAREDQKTTVLFDTLSPTGPI